MKHWNVGDLVDALEKAPRDACLMFEFGHLELGGWESYRGDYAQIALFPANKYDAEMQRCGTVLDKLKKELADGTVHVGYKGGDYPLVRHRDLYVATHGNTSSTAVTGLDVRPYEGGGWAYILTSQIPD